MAGDFSSGLIEKKQSSTPDFTAGLVAKSAAPQPHPEADAALDAATAPQPTQAAPPGALHLSLGAPATPEMQQAAAAERKSNAIAQNPANAGPYALAEQGIDNRNLGSQAPKPAMPVMNELTGDAMTPYQAPTSGKGVVHGAWNPADEAPPQAQPGGEMSPFQMVREGVGPIVEAPADVARLYSGVAGGLIDKAHAQQREQIEQMRGEHPNLAQAADAVDMMAADAQKRTILAKGPLEGATDVLKQGLDAGNQAQQEAMQPYAAQHPQAAQIFQAQQKVNQVIQGLGLAGTQFAEGMTSPESLALISTIELNPEPLLGRVASLYFAGDMSRASYDGIVNGIDAWRKGDTRTAVQNFTAAGGDAWMAFTAGKHGVKGEAEPRAKEQPKGYDAMEKETAQGVQPQAARIEGSLPKPDDTTKETAPVGKESPAPLDNREGLIEEKNTTAPVEIQDGLVAKEAAPASKESTASAATAATSTNNLEIERQPQDALGMGHPDAHRVEEAAIDKVSNKWDTVKENYRKVKGALYNKLPGGLHDSDEYKRVLAENTSEDGKTQYSEQDKNRHFSSPTHNASSVASERGFDEALARPQEGKGAAEISTGMAGSGKSSVLAEQVGDNVNTAAGGNFANPEKFDRYIKKIEDSGHIPQVSHVHIDPVTSFKRVIERGGRSGRFTSLDAFLKMVDIDDTILDAQQRHGFDVKFNFYDNNGDHAVPIGSAAKLAELNKATKKRYNVDANGKLSQSEDLRKALRRTADELYGKVDGFTADDYKKVTGVEAPHLASDSARPHGAAVGMDGRGAPAGPGSQSEAPGRHERQTEGEQLHRPGRVTTEQEKTTPPDKGGVSLAAGEHTVDKTLVGKAPSEIQFKQGTNAETGAGGSKKISGNEKFDAAKAGAIDVWRDPKGQLVAVDGHHRLDLAQADTDTKQIKVNVIEAKSAADAKVYGALKNIAKGNVKPEDVQSFLASDAAKAAGVTKENVEQKAREKFPTETPEVTGKPTYASAKAPNLKQRRAANRAAEAAKPDIGTLNKPVVTNYGTKAYRQDATWFITAPDGSGAFRVTDPRTRDKLDAEFAEKRQAASASPEELPAKPGLKAKREKKAKPAEEEKTPLTPAEMEKFKADSKAAKEDLFKSMPVADKAGYDYKGYEWSQDGGGFGVYEKDGKRYKIPVEAQTPEDIERLRKETGDAKVAKEAETPDEEPQGEATGFPKSTDDITGFEPGALRATFPGAKLIHDEVMNFGKRDVAPALNGIGGGFADGVRKLYKWLSPRSEGVIGKIFHANAPRDAIDALMEMKGEREENIYKMERGMKEIRDGFNEMSQADQIAFIDRVKTGKQQPTPELQAVADLYRKMDDDTYKEIQKFRPNQAYLENHFRVMWKDPKKAGKVFSSIGRRPLQGSKGFMKQHILDDMSEGIARGLEPVTYNPQKLFELAQADALHYISAQKMWKQITDLGYNEFKKPGTQFKNPDFVKLDDNIAQVYFPAAAGDGMIKAGEWYVDANTARLLENYLSKDKIRSSALGKGLMWVKNATTAAELSFSPFHAVFEGIDAGASRFGIGAMRFVNQGVVGGLDAAFKGDWPRLSSEMAQGARGIKEMVTSPAAFFTSAREGGSGIRYFTNPAEFIKTTRGQSFIKQYPDAARLMHDLFSGGGKLAMHEDYKINTLKTFREEWNADNHIGAALRAVPAINELAMRPMFDLYIPRLKVGQFLREYSQQILENHDRLASGDLTRNQLARQVWDRVENRFGEMNFDNLFWDKTFKSAMQLMFRSVTWKLGSLRGIAGAATGQAKEFAQPLEYIKNRAQGKPGGRIAPRLHSDMAWVMGVATMTAMLSTVLQKSMTGKMPSQLLDFVHPQVGGTDDRGKPNRVTLPTYYKDMEHLHRNPVGYLSSSMSEALSRGMEGWNNEDFYGNYVFNPDESAAKKLLDGFAHVAVVKPFAYQNYQQLKKEGGTRSEGAKVLGMFGFNRASRESDLTDAERALVEKQKERGRRPLSPEQVDKAQERKDLLREGREGDPDFHKDLRVKMKEGDLSGRQARDIARREKLTWQQDIFKRATLEEALDAWDKASPQERQEWRPLLAAKAHILKDKTANERTALLPRLRAALRNNATAGIK